MQRLRTTCLKIRKLTGLKAHALAVLAGLASVLSFAPIFAWPIMFVTLPIFILLIDGAINRSGNGFSIVRAGKAAAIGWSFGFGYFFASLFWIGEAFLVEADKFAWALPFAISLLPAALALYFALAAAAAAAFWRQGAVRILMLALALTITEWLRGQLFTGFPWNALGYTLTGNEGLMQWASIFGVYGLSPLAILIFSSPVLIIEPAERENAAFPPRPQNFVFPVAMITLLLAAVILGYMRLASPPTEPVEGVKLRLVQPNTPQKDKWQPAKRREVFRQLMDITTAKSRPGDDVLSGVTHVIWPESSFPFLVLRSRETLSAIADLLPEKTTLLVGALRMDDAAEPDVGGKAGSRRKIYNSLLAIDTNGRTLSIYDKMHLVPFGEYLPFQNLLEAIGFEQLTRLKGGFARGKGPRILSIPGLPATVPLICYEIIFSGNVVTEGEQQKWLLNLTNDAWFGRTSGPYQHFHQARVRAIEEGVPVVRVANTGISAVIDPYGRIVNRLPLITAGAFNSQLPGALPMTTYRIFRGRIILIEIIVLIGAIFVVLRNARSI